MKFAQVNVFSNGTMGNPVACFYNPTLGDHELQQLAHWMNLSETIFIYAATVPTAAYKVRIFTPTLELSFAGHPMIGSVQAAIHFGLLGGQSEFFVQVGCEKVGESILKMKMENGIAFVETPIPKELPVKVSMAEWAEKVFNQPISLLNPLIVDNGPKWLLIQTDFDDIHKLSINNSELKELLQRDKALGLTLYSIHPAGNEEYENSKVMLRALFIDGEIVEDPVCGSANACIAHHLTKYGLLEQVGNEYDAFQGHCCGRRGIVHVKVKDRVWIGGKANIVLKGDYSY
jgi:PhzF family phenazine biosynthesis protein